MLFQTEDTVLEMAFITDVMTPFMVFQAFVTVVRMAFSALETVFVIAAQMD